MKIYHLTGICALFIVLTTFAFTAQAQKLPAVQNSSFMAPANIVIDGKATEWGLSYQAYNKATEIFYTIANDKDNLYLIIHAEKAPIIEKIVESGIEFKINKTKKNTKNSLSVLFPLLPLNIAKTTLTAAGKPISGISYSGKEEMMTGSDATTIALSAAAKKNKQLTVFDKPNKQLHDNLKEIKISGANDITDTIVADKENKYYRALPLHQHNFKIIPIENHDNIRAMLQFDEKGELTYELAVPLKYLSTVSANNKLFYNVSIHGRGEDGRPGNVWTYKRSASGERETDNQDLENVTDFSGEYTLAK